MWHHPPLWYSLTILVKSSHTRFLIIIPFSSSTKFPQLFAKMNCSIRPSKFNPGFYCPSARLDTPTGNFLRQYAPPTYFNFRLKNFVTLELQQKLLPAYASKINPSEGSDGANGEGAQGPPFLTILAGILVFFALCWMIGSLSLWLIGLFVRA